MWLQECFLPIFVEALRPLSDGDGDDVVGGSLAATASALALAYSSGIEYRDVDRLSISFLLPGHLVEHRQCCDLSVLDYWANVIGPPVPLR